jgi:hypothetical protein
MIFASCVELSGQNYRNTQKSVENIQTVTLKNDTTINILMPENFQILMPDNTLEYNISNYKNIDLLKTNPFQLETAGLSAEVYISNTQQGVIVITSSVPNDVLRDYNSILRLNPNLYDFYSNHDTLVFNAAQSSNNSFDFTKASTIRHDYLNAFNYTVDPRTGISWSKTNNDIFKQNWGLGSLIYDLIIVAPK